MCAGSLKAMAVQPDHSNSMMPLQMYLKSRKDKEEYNFETWKGNHILVLINLFRERRRLGLSNPQNYGAQIQLNSSMKDGNQGSPINSQAPIDNFGQAQLLPHSSDIHQMNQQLYHPQMVQDGGPLQQSYQQQMMGEPQWNVSGQVQYQQPVHPLTALYETNPYLVNQLNTPFSKSNIQQFEGQFANAPAVIPQQLQMQQQQYQEPAAIRPNRFQEQQLQQPDLQDFYRKNINSTIFNQRSRSYQQHQQLSQQELKNEYARVLEFQQKEREAQKHYKQLENRSPSPENYQFFEKFGQNERIPQEIMKQEKQRYLRDILSLQIEEKGRKKEQDKRDKDRQEQQINRIIDSINQKHHQNETSKLYDSTIVGHQNQVPTMTDDYKEQLIEQINEKKMKEEIAKKKKYDDEMKDEQRVLKELQELNSKYQKEIKQTQSTTSETGEKKHKELKKQETAKTESEQVSNEQDNIPKFLKGNNSARLNIEEQPIGSNRSTSKKKNKKNPMIQFKEYPSDQDVIRTEQAQISMDPMKKQMQVQMTQFGKEMKKLQKQQDDMLKNYSKEIDNLQKKKVNVIKDIKDTQDTSMKQQIHDLQKTIEKLTNKVINQASIPQSINAASPSQPQLSHRQKQQQQPQPHMLSPNKITPTRNLSKPMNSGRKKSHDEVIVPALANKKFKDKKNEKIIQRKNMRDFKNLDEEQKDVKIKIINDEIVTSEDEMQKHDDSRNNGSSFVIQARSKQEQSGFDSQRSSVISQVMGKSNDNDQPSTKQFPIQKKMSFKSKMKSHQLSSSPTSKRGGKQVTKARPPNKKNGKDLSTLSINSRTKFSNEENEPLGISNMLKRAQTLERDNEDKFLETARIPQALPSSLKNHVNRGQKSVRIFDTALNNLVQEQYSPLPNEIQDSEFFMGRAEPSVYGDIGNSILQQSRDIEKNYYEDVLKPNKYRQNLESHMNDDQLYIEEHKEMDSIAGIIVKSDEQLLGDLKEEQLDSNQFTDFLYQKNLIFQDEIDSMQQPYSKQQDAKLPDPLPSYTLKEKEDHESSAFYQDNADENIGSKLTDIQRIMNENSRVSEDYRNKQDQEDIHQQVQFNRAFEKNLKYAQHMFDVDIQEHKKQRNPSNGSINLSQEIQRYSLSEMIKNQQRAQEQIEEKLDEQRVDLAQDSQNEENEEEEEGIRPQFIKEEDKINISQDLILPYQSQEEEEENKLPPGVIGVFDQHKLSEYLGEEEAKYHEEQNIPVLDEVRSENTDELLSKQRPKQSHLINFLLQSKQQPINLTDDYEEIRHKIPKMPMIKSQKSLGSLGRRFHEAVKQNPSKDGSLVQSMRLITPKHNSNSHSLSVLPPLPSRSLTRNGSKLNTYKQVSFHDLALERESQIIPNKGHQHQKQKQRPPLPIMQQQKKIQKILKEISSPSHGLNGGKIFQSIFRDPNVIGSIHKKEQEEQTPKHKHINADEPQFNVFTENSQINDMYMPHQPINPYFKNEQIKLKDMKDPFAISINLREKLKETNSMITIDNQTLLDKIKFMDKSIKPIQFNNYPMINLTKNEAESLDEAEIHQRVFMSHAKQNIKHLNDKLGLVPKSYNFADEVIQASIPHQQEQYPLKKLPTQSLPVDKQAKLMNFASQMNNTLIYDIVKNKVNSESINISQTTKAQQNKPFKELLNFLKEVNDIPILEPIIQVKQPEPPTYKMAQSQAVNQMIASVPTVSSLAITQSNVTFMNGDQSELNYDSGQITQQRSRILDVLRNSSEKQKQSQIADEDDQENPSEEQTLYQSQRSRNNFTMEQPYVQSQKTIGLLDQLQKKTISFNNDHHLAEEIKQNSVSTPEKSTYQVQNSVKSIPSKFIVEKQNSQKQNSLIRKQTSQKLEEALAYSQQNSQEINTSGNQLEQFYGQEQVDGEYQYLDENQNQIQGDYYQEEEPNYQQNNDSFYSDQSFKGNKYLEEVLEQTEEEKELSNNYPTGYLKGHLQQDYEQTSEAPLSTQQYRDVQHQISSANQKSSQQEEQTQIHSRMTQNIGEANSMNTEAFLQQQSEQFEKDELEMFQHLERRAIQEQLLREVDTPARNFQNQSNNQSDDLEDY